MNLFLSVQFNAFKKNEMHCTFQPHTSCALNKSYVNVLSFKPGFNRLSRSKLHKPFFGKMAPGYFYRELNGNVFSAICLCFIERIVTVVFFFLE